MGLNPQTFQSEPVKIKIVKSDWDRTTDESFDKTSKGLYSLKSLEDVKARGYASKGDILGAISPSGRTFLGSSGYRAEEAQVKAIFRRSLPCFVCEQPARWVMRNNQSFALCDKCISRLTKLMKKKGLKQEDIDEVLVRLAEEYGAEVVDLPADWDQ
jgi:hypothetical protein